MISFFKTMSGGCITLEYEYNNTIKEIKEMLSKKMNSPSEELHIIFCGKECLDDKITEYYKFWKENCAYVVSRKPKDFSNK